MLLLYSQTLYFDYLYINIDNKDFIETDNEFSLNGYENEITFLKTQNKIKTIAFYYPEFYNISFLKFFNNTEKSNLLAEEKIQKLLNAQIKLAKRHEIYGFAVFYNLNIDDFYSKNYIYDFLNNESFPFF